MSQRYKILLFVSVVIVGIVLRIFFPSATIMTGDSTLYIALAERIAEGHLTLDHANSITEIIQPGYSFFIMIAKAVLQDGPLAGIVVSFVCGLALVFLAYWCGKKIFSEGVGLIAAAIVSCYPLLIYYSTTVLTESLFTLLFIGVVFLFWRALEHKKWWHFLLLGVVVGCSYYVRIVGLAAVPVVFLWLCVDVFYHRRLKVSQAAIAFSVFVMSIVIVIAPYLVFLYNQKQTFVITGVQDYAYSIRQNYTPEDMKTPETRQSVFYSLTEDNTEYEYNKGAGAQSQSLVKMIGTYWKYFSTNLGYNIIFVLLIFWQFVVIVGYIAYRYFKKRTDVKIRAVWYLVSWLFFYLLLYWMGRPHLRYYVPILPILFLLAAYGVQLFVKKIREKQFRLVVWLLTIIAIISFGFMTSSGRGYTLTPLGFWKESIEERIGSTVGEYISSDAKVLSTYPIITHYAHGRHYQLPVDDYSSITTFAKHNSISYLLLYQPENQFNRPELNVMYTIQEDDNVNLLYSDDTVYLFEFKDTDPV